MTARKLLLGVALVLALSSAARAEDNPLIYGIHDAAGWEPLKGTIGWVLETTTVQDGADPLGYLRPITDSGVTVIVRLNNGYGTQGTIPLTGTGRRYATNADFAAAVAAMVARCPHVKHWIIGNEVNLDGEWPADASGARVPLTVAAYVACYQACYDAIHSVRSDVKVMPSPVAPYAGDLGTGDGNSLAYFTKLMAACADRCDAVALHAYTHGQDPLLASSEGMMGMTPDMHSDFRVYRDFLGALPDALRAKPVYVTECDPGFFANANTGWVQAIYHEVRDWNAQAGTQRIRCVCLYRWLDDDPGYGIVKDPEVLKDFAAARAEKTTWSDGIVNALDGATKHGALQPAPAAPAPPVAPAPPAAPAPPPPAATLYTIDFGDTLSSIAAGKGLSLQQLLDFKGDGVQTNRDRLAASSPMTGARRSDVNLIFPGQTVYVPD